MGILSLAPISGGKKSSRSKDFRLCITEWVSDALLNNFCQPHLPYYLARYAMQVYVEGLSASITHKKKQMCLIFIIFFFFLNKESRIQTPKKKKRKETLSPQNVILILHFVTQHGIGLSLSIFGVHLNLLQRLGEIVPCSGIEPASQSRSK